MKQVLVLFGALGMSIALCGGGALAGAGSGLGSLPQLRQAPTVPQLQYVRLRHKCCIWRHHHRKCWWVPAGAMCPLRD